MNLTVLLSHILSIPILAHKCSNLFPEIKSDTYLNSFSYGYSETIS